MTTIIIDSNIGAKLFTQEADSQQAVDLLSAGVLHKHTFLAPELFKYEIASIAFRKRIAIEPILDFFEEHVDKVVGYVKPSTLNWLKAEEISKSGNDKSGFPAMYDSIYQAIAIEHNGVFITADKRHYVKAEKHGHIALLEDWEKVLPE
jgi:predicted nucleic acid-binding protein